MSNETLPEFLLARTVEAQRHAESLALTMQSDSFTAPASLVMVGAIVDPARVLADCAAKRRIVERYEMVRAENAAAREITARVLSGAFSSAAAPTRVTRYDETVGLTVALRALALPYADHPDFNDEWRA